MALLTETLDRIIKWVEKKYPIFYAGSHNVEFEIWDNYVFQD